MKLKIAWTHQFKKDYKAAMNQHRNIAVLDDTIRILSKGEELPGKFKDYSLKGIWAGFRECHIAPDLLLIYRIDEDVLVLTLTRTGSHSNFFC